VAKVVCPGKKSSPLNLLLKKRFIPLGHLGKNRSTGWNMRGHGGERVIAGNFVDGYCPETKTVF